MQTSQNGQTRPPLEEPNSTPPTKEEPKKGFLHR